MQALLLFLLSSLAISGESVPFQALDPSQPKVGAIDGTINGQKATHALMGSIDVYSVLLQKVTNYNDASAACKQFTAGGSAWELPTLSTLLGIAMAGGGQTVKALSTGDSESELLFWAKGHNAEEQKILDHSRKLLFLGSALRTEIVDLNEVDAKIAEELQKPNLSEEQKKNLEAFKQALAQGFVVLCVNKNLKID